MRLARLCSLVCAFFCPASGNDYTFLSTGIINLVLGVMLIISSKRRDVALLWPSIVVLYVQIGFAVRSESLGAC